MLKKDISASG
uniref:Uncharacterized protein n=1 Tax=Arundo donax TaxID=35708 RepID=A0A0A8YKD2_ARUDO